MVQGVVGLKGVGECGVGVLAQAGAFASSQLSTPHLAPKALNLDQKPETSDFQPYALHPEHSILDLEQRK